MTRYVLGVDGGGTRTRAAIATEAGELLATGEAGPANFDDIGVAPAQANLAAAVAAARRAARVVAPFSAAFLGVAGVVSRRDRDVVRGMARALELAPDDAVAVDHDCRIALAGALSGRPGIVLIVGTGSSCYGRTADGRTWRAGGWGSLVSDEGSAYWLGLEALRAVSRMLDRRGPATVLAEPVLDRLGIAEPDELMHRMYVPGLARAEIAAMAPIVTGAAHRGDAVAAGLVRRGIAELAECVQTVADELGFGDGLEVSAVGGLAQGDPTIVDALATELARRGVPVGMVAAEQTPVQGACRLGADLLTRSRADASAPQPSDRAR